MNESYESLFQAYQRLKARVKDLEEQLGQKQTQWSEREAETAITNRMVRELCEDILSRKKQKTDKGNSWMRMSLKELLTEAKKAFAEYSVDNRETLSQVLRTAEDRRMVIEGLENQISVMKNNPGTATLSQEEILKAVQKEREMEQLMLNAGSKAKQALDEGRITVLMEDTDEFDVLEQELLEASMNLTEQARITPKSIPMTESRKRKEEMKKFKDNHQKTMYMEDIAEYEKELTDMDMTLLLLLGTTGVSIQKEILEKMMKKDVEYNETAIRQSLKKLQNMHLLKKEDVRTPLRGGLKLFRLDEKGIIIYKGKTGKKPVKSEMEKVISEHDSYPHGYGILEIAALLEKMPYVKSVRSMNRNNPIQLGAGSSVIPDIICTDTNDARMYIEYECGNHNQTNFSAKCSKLCKLDKCVNIIAPNDDAMKKLMGQVVRWMTSKGHSIDQYTIRLTTSAHIKDRDLRKNSGWKIVYHPEKGVEPVVNF